MESFLISIISIVVLIIFIVMAVNIGTLVRINRGASSQLTKIEQHLRIIAKLQAGQPLTGEEKAKLLSEAKTR